MSWALIKPVTQRVSAPLLSHAENVRALLAVGICLALLGNWGRGMLNRKEKRGGKLGSHGFCYKEGFAHSCFLSCNNKQARQEGTNSPSPVFVFSFARCLPDPSPGVSGCGLFVAGSHRFRVPGAWCLQKGSLNAVGLNGSVSSSRGRRSVATHACMCTRTRLQVRIPWGFLPQWQSCHMGDFQQRGCRERGVLVARGSSAE